MEKHTSKARVADSNLAAAALMNASGTGSSLFVINLCASQAPAANIGKSLPGLETYRLYQVARREDGRTRYRLRLGFFTSEADAEAVLNSVRHSFPTAFTACLCDEDRKFTRGFAPEPSTPPAPARIAVVAKPVTAPAAPSKPAATAAPAKPAAAPKATPAPAAQPAAAHDTKRAAAQPAPQARTPAPQAARAPVASDPIEIELSWEPPQLQAPPNAPAHVVSTTSKTPQVIKAAPAAAKTAQIATPVAPTTKTAPNTTPAAATAKTAQAAKPAAPVATKAAPPAPAAKPAAQPKAPPKATIEAPAKLRAAIELSLESESKPAAAPKANASAPSTEPFRVSKGVDIPTSSLSLESTAKMRAIAQPAPTAAAKPAAQTPTPSTGETSKMKAAQAAAPASIKESARNLVGNLPELDSTQTIRALTSDELQDESQEKWFAIQLAVSDQPVNLETMPRLDIFEAYRLYSVASAGSGKITHSLRIGFFREEVSAQAVSGYLTTFFATPSVVRISIAEQARFKDPPVARQKPTPKAEVLDLSHARERTSRPIPTVTMEVETPRFDPTATGTFKASSTGVHKALTSSTGAHRALGATGTHKALKFASKASPPPTKRSASTSATGKHKSLQPKKSLEEQLLDEAREVELSASGIRKLPKSDSLLSKMFGKRSKS